MLIRSQSGNSLLNVFCLDVVSIREIFENFRIITESDTTRYIMGDYSSRKKALKVLDEIERCFVELPPNSVYHMPADDEVEV